MIYNYGKIKVKLNVSYLRQDSIYFIHSKFIFCLQLDARSRDLNTDSTLSSCLFGAVNSDPHKYGDSG